ncbi:MAG TPA: glycosyltransferase [Bacteroidales bacterium]|nr:glycosyltransferase [Bacteroidales bacterium]
MSYWFLPILTVPYLILLLDIYRHLLRIKPFRPDHAPSVFISVVIACKNEQDNMPDLLVGLSKQNYPLNLFEVIIVDDHSTDRTIASAVSYSYLLDLKILSNEGTGKKQALRKGIECARGELIVTTDADCTPTSLWLQTIASFYNLHKPELIISPVRLSRKKGFFGRFQELEFLSLQGITAGTAAGNKAVMCNGANLAFTKKAYAENAGNLRFDIPTGDDVFLLHSIKKSNSLILWLESHHAVTETEASPDLTSFLKQRKRWASKSTSYNDNFSVLLGIVTFVTNLIVVVLLTGSIFNQDFLKLFLMAFLIKSLPDYLILSNVTKRYGRRNLMRWFLPCQVIYPFYVLTVAAFALTGSNRRRG